MLDFNKLLQQIENVGQDSFVDRDRQVEILRSAVAAYEQATTNPTNFATRLQENESLVLWPVAKPLEPFGKVFPVTEFAAPYTVVGVDGSQIMPSHHEAYACYLLNTGIATISYDSSHKPILESVPHLYHRPEDLYPLVDRRRLHIDELYVSLERNLLELQTLADLSQKCKERELPVLAMLDGSLIPWSVEKLSPTYQQNYIARMQSALSQLREANIAVIGYLSKSRASDLINCLRISICPFPSSDCRLHCATINEEDFPCSKIWPLSDRQVFFEKLPYGTRSCLFQSGAKIAKSFTPAHHICFTYLHVGSEIARLEFPHWLMQSGKLIDFALSAVLSQVKKGMGYPICLAEAHNLAVIRSHDRERFFHLLANHMIEIGLRSPTISPKELRKRIGFV